MVLANANELSIFKFGWHFVRYRNVEIIHGIILITHIWIFGFDQSLRTCFEEWNVACPLEILSCQITQCFLFFFSFVLIVRSVIIQSCSKYGFK